MHNTSSALAAARVLTRSCVHAQVRRSVHDEYDGYIIVSFANATLVLSIGDTVEEVNDSGFLGTVPTLRAQLLEDSSLVQVSRAPPPPPFAPISTEAGDSCICHYICVHISEWEL